MSWDLSQNLQTGDWEWDSKRDLTYADGLRLIQERIHRRLMINRGEFLYDRSGQLGSRLRSLLNMGVPTASTNLAMIIKEALAPMQEILVTDVITYTYNDGTGVVTSPNNIYVSIQYQLNPANASLPPEALGEFQTGVSITV